MLTPRGKQRVTAMSLLVGSVLLRPYVFIFLLVYVALAVRDLGGRRAALFTAWVGPVAFLAEFSSTRIGIPFGLYHYTGLTRGQELFISDVPFFDSLSFTFLAYAAFCLARAVSGALDLHAPGRAPTRSAPTASLRATLTLGLLSGVLMMLLDVVIDPLAVRGDRWFLGPIFWYPSGGVYFGVPLSNYAGWLIVGAIGVGGYMLLARDGNGCSPTGGVGLYYGVLLFNVVMTAWIGEWLLLTSGLALHLIVVIVVLMSRSSPGFARAILGGGLGRRA
jgi:uncharacterized membrane protein